MDDKKTTTTPTWPKKRRGWLIITRSREQELVIDGKIVVRIVDIRGDRVRVGINAPVEIIVARREVATPEQLAAIEPEVRG